MMGIHRSGRRLGATVRTPAVAGFFLLIMVWSTGGCADNKTGPMLTEGAIQSDHLPAMGKGLIAARCFVCHSADLITQQRLNRKQWTAVIEKMVRWGAMLSESEKAVITDYLASRYHQEAEQVAEDLAAPEPADALPTAAQGDALRGDRLYQRNCLPCHGASAAGGMGPRLAQNRILTDGPRFFDTVLKGRGAMPAWAQVLTPQEIADIQAWLKTL